MKFIIDADTPALLAARQSTIVTEFPEARWCSIGWRTDEIKECFLAHIADWTRRCASLLEVEDYEITLAFTDGPSNPVGPGEVNFRKSVFADYKSNRGKKGKPHGYYYLLEWLWEEQPHETLIWPGLEADDICGILHTRHANNSVIISIDKDMKTIPGVWFNPDKDMLMRQTYGGAERAHMLQTVHGDSTDGYPGLRGMGEKTLEKYLIKNDLPLSWKTLQELWGNEKPTLLSQARMAKILTKENYFDNRLELFSHPDINE